MTGGVPPGTSTLTVVLVPPADLALEPPGGTVEVYKSRSDLAVEDTEERTLGRLGFGGELHVKLGQGVHSIHAVGDLDAHPGCEPFENPEIPQSQCYESGWNGYAHVGILGPDYGEAALEGNTPDVLVRDGESGTLVLTLSPGCGCND
ncbi:MAG: hypothetical protein ACK4YP_24655 [Myxococcota bacterium]